MQSDTAVVVSEGVAQSTPPVAIETALDADRVELDAATVASEEAAQSVPPEVQMEEVAAASGPAGADAAVVAPEVGRMGEDTAGGSPGILVVVGRTRRPSPPALLSGGSRSPVQGEPPLHWMDARDPSSALFSLDDVAESVERENLDIGFSAVINALNQANGALREIIVPSSRVFALFSSFYYPCVFVF